MSMTRTAVLRGGPSSEYEVSLATGAGVHKALQSKGLFSKDVVISTLGEWIVDGRVRSPEQALVDVDVVFIALHGEYGEDGTVQRILERNCIPYTGSGPMSSAIAMNKTFTKAQLKELGIKMPKHMRITRDGLTDPVRTAESICKLFGPQFFVKPERGGSSVATYLVRSEAELAQFILKALESAPEVLVEERIIGKEATVGVLENFRGDSLYLLPPIEIIPPQEADFFDYANKYSGSTQEICPGNFSKSEKTELMQLAELVHQTLNLRHYSRSDFIVAADGIYFLEVNTLPGLTAESLFPKAVEAVGSCYADLIAHLIDLAIQTKR